MKKLELIKLSDLPKAIDVGAELRLEPRQSDSWAPLYMRMGVFVFFLTQTKAYYIHGFALQDCYIIAYPGIAIGKENPLFP